jgi:predicted nucleic acid-binding protein
MEAAGKSYPVTIPPDSCTYFKNRSLLPCRRLLRVREITALARVTIEWDDLLEERAEELEKSGLEAMDALHVASAERAGAIMLTTDDVLI